MPRVASRVLLLHHYRVFVRVRERDGIGVEDGARVIGPSIRTVVTADGSATGAANSFATGAAAAASFISVLHTIVPEMRTAANTMQRPRNFASLMIANVRAKPRGKQALLPRPYGDFCTTPIIGPNVCGMVSFTPGA